MEASLLQKVYGSPSNTILEAESSGRDDIRGNRRMEEVRDEVEEDWEGEGVSAVEGEAISELHS